MVSKIDSIKPKLLELKNNGKTKSEICQYIQEKTNLSPRRARHWAAIIWDANSEISNIKDLESKDKYFYNASTKKYVFPLKKVGKNIVMEKGLVDRIIKSYSNFDGNESSISELSLKFNIPKPVLTEILAALSFTHDEIPILQEDLADKTEEELLDELIQNKKFNLYQKFLKGDWQKTIKNAENWLNFKMGYLNPFDDLLNSWKTPKLQTYQPKEKTNTGNDLCVLVSDTHVGAYANGKTLFNGKEQSTPRTVENIRKYYQSIIQDIKNYNLKLDSINILFLGDILHTATPFSTTTKGTPLTSDVLNEEMFEEALNIFIEFIHNLSKTAPNTNVYSCSGNHFGVGDSLLAKTLSIYFKDQSNMKFEVFKTHTGLVKINNTLIAMSHGAHNEIKAKLPGGAKRESYIQGLLLNNPDKLQNIKQKVYISADQHHLETKEYHSFHHIMAPSMVLGDKFADALNLNSRPSQIVLLLDKSGVKSMLSYYFD